MKQRIIATLMMSFILSVVATNSHAQNPPNWTPQQLMEPAELAAEIKANGSLPIIYSVGPGAPIPHSTTIGMTNSPEGISQLKAALQTVPKDRNIVIYCGCCPFEHCPNVRPAINVLKELKFTNYHLLNLPDNIKKNWIDEGYPVDQSRSKGKESIKK